MVNVSPKLIKIALSARFGLSFYRFSAVLPIIYGQPKLLKIALPGTILVDTFFI